MKTIIGIITITIVLLIAPIARAQGTLTYLSNLGQASGGSLAVGSNSWLGAPFRTGINSAGYLLDSIQLGMADASNNPSGFKVMLYNFSNGGLVPGQSLGTLNGSLNPSTSGIYTFTPASSLVLSASTYYYIVLTAATSVASGAYDWSYTSANSYNPVDGWFFLGTGIVTSNDGLSWPGYNTSGYPQFAINATAVPEPGVFSLLALGGVGLLWQRRKA